MTGRTLAIAGLAAAALAVGAWFVLADGGGPGLEVLPDSDEAAAEEAARNAGFAVHAAPKAAAVANAAYRIRGVVVDVEGAPVPDARVWARRTGAVYDMNDPKTWGEWGTAAAFARTTKELDAPSLEDEKGTVEVASGADGSFLLEPTESGNWAVSARLEAPRVATRTTAAVTNAKPEAKVRLTVWTGTKLVGRVVDAADAPVAAVVKGSWAPTPSNRSGGAYFSPPAARTDAGGGFVFDAVPAGKGSLSVTLPGRMSFSGIEIVTPYEGTFTIRLGGGGVLLGRVLDAQGAPVAGADVVATVSAPAAAGSREATTCRPRSRSGPDGAWRADGVLPGKVSQMSVSAPGYTLLQQNAPRAVWAGAEVKAGQETAIDLVVKKGGAVAGRVTESGTRAPIEGVEVRLVRGDSNQTTVPPTMVTEADGRFRFEDVPLGKHVLLPQSATHFSPEVESAVSVPQSRIYSADAAARTAPPTLTVVLTTEGETAEREFEMRRGLTVKGRVVGPDGAPVEGAKVRSGTQANLQWQWGTSWSGGDFGLVATSGADGRFEARGLAPREDWVLTAAKDSFLGKPCEKFALSAAAPAPDVVLELLPGASVSGKVLDADGKPAVGWNVWYWAQEAQNFQQNTNTTTDAEGAFLVQGLPAGKGQLQVNGAGGTVQKPLDPPLTAGEKRLDVEVRAEKAAEISGTVVDAEGKPVSGLGLNAMDENGRGSGSWGSTRGDGTFTLNGRVSGKTRIHANEPTDQGYTQNVALGDAVQAPASGLRLVYTPKKRMTITGRIVDPAGRPVPLCLVSSTTATPRNYGGANADETVGGEFVRSFEGSPPFQLSVSAPRDSRGRALNLRPKQVTVTDPKEPVLVTLEAGLEVAGRVTGPDGKGVIGVTMRGGGVSSVTDEEGSFRLGGLPNETEVEVTVQAPARYAPPGPVRAKVGAKDVSVRLALGASVVGRVVGPDGKGLPNAGINASWKSTAGAPGSTWANSGADGAFRVEGLPDDALLTLDVNLWGNEGNSRYRPVRLTDVRAGTADLVIRMESGATIEGRVVHPDGSPSTFSWISATREDKQDGNPLYAQPQGAEGVFTIGGCEPGAVYILRVHGGNGGTLGGESVRVEAPARNLRVVVVPPAKLSGRLEGLAGDKQYWVQGWPVGADPDSGSVSAQVSSDGAFSLEVAADKDYVLYAASTTGEDRYAIAGPVRAGGGDVVLKWQPGLTIEGRVDDLPAGDAYVMAKGERCRVSAKVEDGRFRLRGLPAGRYALSLYAQSSQSAADSADAGATGVHLRWQPK